MPPKRASDDEPQLINKIQRIEHGSPQQRQPNHDFSGSVKQKLANSRRTGQACDRCKIRKIRCDGRPEGCTPCDLNRTQCVTTDRITKRPTVRGQAEATEAENTHLRTHIADLQAQLKEAGIEPRPFPAYNTLQPRSDHWRPSSQANGSSSWSDPQRRMSTSSLPGYAPAGSRDQSEFRSLPQFKHGSIGDNYLGVGVGDSPLSHIRGTSLSVFGTEIDITDYMEDEAEYERSIMSYSSLLREILGSEPVDPVPLPPYQMLKEYATWYLRSLNPYTMLVHKPAFMDLVWKFGNDPEFKPTNPEVIMVHMMLATIQYQIATRNSHQNELLDESHRHYRYALNFYKKLLSGKHRLEDIQALTMICHHLRTFPKPGAAWIMTSITYLFAIELGLHRSVKNWADGTGKLSKLDIEMRKRVFWTLNALQVNLNGKLGRPMPISNEDIDVEFPEPMNDCLPGEEAVDEFHQCSFQVGIQIAKYTVLEADLYKMIYTVRYSPSAYIERLRRLETGIQQWKDELPYELRDPMQASLDDFIFTLYLEYWYQAYNLLLHHPSVCHSVDPEIVNSNLDKCLDASEKMLYNCNEMMLKKSLDIPWINTVVYIAAIFTTLFISSMRKEQLSSVNMTKLKGDMATWVNILGECDHFLGSGNKLKNAISNIVDQLLGDINNSMVKRTATESLAHVLQTPLHRTSSTPVYDTGGYREQFSTAASGPTDPAMTSQPAGYNGLAGGATHPYNLGNPVTTPQQASIAFEQDAYSIKDEPGMTSTHAAALAAASNNTPQPSNGYAYANAHVQVSHSGQPAYVANGFAPQEWRQWTRTYMQPQPLGQPGEYLNTATTLMALGGREGGSQCSGNDSQGSLDNTGIQEHLGHAHWPEISFPGAANGRMSQH